MFAVSRVVTPHTVRRPIDVGTVDALQRSMNSSSTSAEGSPSDSLGAVLGRIGHDVRTIAADELKLGHEQVAGRLESFVVKAGLAMVGAMVVLIGFAMLCMTAVVALRGLIAPLWLCASSSCRRCTSRSSACTVLVAANQASCAICRSTNPSRKPKNGRTAIKKGLQE